MAGALARGGASLTQHSDAPCGTLTLEDDAWPGLADLFVPGERSSPNERTVHMDTDAGAIKNVLREYARCCNGGDFDGWISLWAENGVQMPPDAPSRVGTAEIRAGMKPAFDTMNLNVVIRQIDEVRVNGDRALSRCTYSLSMTPKAGGQTIEAMPDGKALTLYEKQADTWQITYDCFNSNIPPK